MKHIMDAIDKLSKTHPEHISQYGTGALSLGSCSAAMHGKSHILHEDELHAVY